MPSLGGAVGWLNPEPPGPGRNMPCEGAWTDEQVELLRAWLADGAPQ